MSRTTQSNTRLDQIPEILLEIISCLDQLSRINLAIAYPKIFLGPAINIFRLDAMELLNWKDWSEICANKSNMKAENPDPSASIDNSNEDDVNNIEKVNGMTKVEYYQIMMPLLYTAIENDISIPVIREIIAAYVSVCATSIDGIWGGRFLPYLPPLLIARVLRKPRVVSLLIDEGADPSLLRQQYGPISLS
ncbi:hypothetical protein F5Y12DRAFT_791557 [Xylaria sp. FL1777]|nr:hypothetical protein F5Y12DRAFT_791557 [Xylaria sp. FL1777]